MPIYEYRCGKCGFQKEFLQRISDAPLKKCPECGKPALKKLLSAAGFHLKGTGWYATDFKGGGAKPEAKKKDDKPAASSDKPADSASKDTAKPAAETKPAAEIKPAVRAADASTN